MSLTIRLLSLTAVALFAAAAIPSQAEAFSGSFWRNRARAPLWPAPKRNLKCDSIGDNEFRACYFAGQNFDELKKVNDTDSIDFDWGTGSPDSSVPADGFSARYTGSFQLEGSLKFTLTSDDGVRLWIDDQLAIDQWTIHAPTTVTHTRTLSRGKHKIQLEYFEAMGGALLSLSWAPAGGGPGTGGSTPGCVNGVLSDPKSYFFSIIGKAEGLNANDWATVMDQSGIPTAPGPFVRPDSRVHFGITQQRNSAGEVRGRIFLPADRPDDNGYYLHAVDVLAGSDGSMIWKWSDWIGGQSPYAPPACD